jgi:preprotein translocase SecE subunit
MFKTIVKFIQEARTELMKVSWPTRTTVINLTLAVLGISLLFSLYTAGVDLGLTKGIQLLANYSATHKTGTNSPTNTPINVKGVTTTDGTPIQVK